MFFLYKEKKEDWVRTEIWSPRIWFKVQYFFLQWRPILAYDKVTSELTQRVPWIERMFLNKWIATQIIIYEIS